MRHHHHGRSGDHDHGGSAIIIVNLPLTDNDDPVTVYDRHGDPVTGNIRAAALEHVRAAINAELDDVDERARVVVDVLHAFLELLPGPDHQPLTRADLHIAGYTLAARYRTG